MALSGAVTEIGVARCIAVSSAAQEAQLAGRQLGYLRPVTIGPVTHQRQSAGRTCQKPKREGAMRRVQPMRTVVRVTRLKPHRWNLELNCGHKFDVVSRTKPARKFAPCPRCAPEGTPE